MVAAITIVDLVKRFPRAAGYRELLPWHRAEQVTALDGISLEVYEGELLGLLGPNGAGKTTLMKILSTLVLPTVGRALVHGRDVVGDDQEVRKLVGLITADERSFYWRLTGRQNLEFYAALYQLSGRAGRRRVADLLDLVGLSDAADRRFQTYSTGMRQKLAIARGLLADPRVLLVDEPTRSLDPLSAQAVRSFLKEKVARQGCTVLLATHHMAEAEQLSDRVAIIHHGRLLACGSVEKLRLSQRSDRYYLEVEGLAATHWGELARLPGLGDLQFARLDDGSVALDAGLVDNRAGLPRLLEAIMAAGGRVRACSRSERPLEGIFIDLVNEANAPAAGAQQSQPILAEAGSTC